MPSHILFSSDYHLGLSRTAGTTPDSRARLRDIVLAQAKDVNKLAFGILSISGAPDSDDIERVCLGDFFDSYSNTEEILLSTLDLFTSMSVVVAGNHDITNRKGTLGSLQYFDEVLGPISPAKITPFGSAKVHTHDVGNTHLVIVPHVASQELFEKALDNSHKKILKGRSNLLLLHCNFELEFEHSETTLNLSRERAHQLLEHFNHILLGHEHNPRDELDNRLHVIGCPFPTSFADMTDKRVLLWDVSAARFETIPVWDLASGYREMTPQQPVEGILASFVRIRGEVPAEELSAVLRNIKTLWKDNPRLLAVSAEIKIAGDRPDSGREIATSAESLVSLVQKELRGTDLLSLFNALLNEVQSRSTPA